jgi:hypothetical protein
VCRPAVSILGRGWPELVPVAVVVAFPHIPTAAHPRPPVSTLHRGCRDVPPAGSVVGFARFYAEGAPMAPNEYDADVGCPSVGYPFSAFGATLDLLRHA